MRLLKLFLYVTDILDKNAPLTFLPHDGLTRYPGMLATIFLTENCVEFEGPSKSTLIMDSASLYHFGSRCIEPRLTFVIQYNSEFEYLRRTQKNNHWKNQRESLSEIQRLALGWA